MRARCLPLLLMLLSPAALALEVKDVDPHVIATVLPGEPPRLRLSWQPMADVASFSVLRRAPGAPAWDAPLEGALPGDFSAAHPVIHSAPGS